MLPHRDEFHTDFAHVFLSGNITDRVINPKRWVELNQYTASTFTAKPRLLWRTSQMNTMAALDFQDTPQPSIHNPVPNVLASSWKFISLR